MGWVAFINVSMCWSQVGRQGGLRIECRSQDFGISKGNAAVFLGVDVKHYSYIPLKSKSTEARKTHKDYLDFFKIF